MKKFLTILTALVLAGVLGCSDSSATLVVRMTDAPGDPAIATVNVEILRVDVVQKNSKDKDVDLTNIKKGEGVYTVYEPATPIRINLLELTNGITMLMGEITLDAGEYIQLRLIVSTNSTITFVGDDAVYPLSTPSGTTSGIKIKGKGNDPLFTIGEGETAELVFDFDAALSINSGGLDKDNYKLSPVIKEIKYRAQVMAQTDFDTEK